MVLRLCRWSVPLLIALLGGCPLPFEFSGEGSGIAGNRNPSDATVTAPVTFSYAERGGRTGTIADKGSHTANVGITVTLATETPDAVIYYTTDGSGIPDLGSATRVDASAATVVVPLAASTERREISAVAVGPGMRPSPITTANVAVTKKRIEVPETPIRTLTYARNDPSGLTAMISVSGGAIPPAGAYQEGRTITLPDPKTPSSPQLLIDDGTTHYEFDGWNTQADGGGTAYPAGTDFTIPAGDVTLYAKWVQVYRLTYDQNGGGVLNDGAMPGVGLHRAGASLTLPNPSNPGGTLRRQDGAAWYEFDGWNTQADGGGTAYPAGTDFTIPAGDVTLYAKWVQLYVIEYHISSHPAYYAAAGDAAPYELLSTVAKTDFVRSDYTLPTGTDTYTGSDGTTSTFNTTDYTLGGWNTHAQAAAQTTLNPANASDRIYVPVVNQAVNIAGSDQTASGTTFVIKWYAFWNQTGNFAVTYRHSGGTGGGTLPTQDNLANASASFTVSMTLAAQGGASVPPVGWQATIVGAPMTGASNTYVDVSGSTSINAIKTALGASVVARDVWLVPKF